MMVAIDRYLMRKPGAATNMAGEAAAGRSVAWALRSWPSSIWSRCCSAYLFEFVQTYLMQWIGQKMMFDLRREIFRHMQRMHVGFFDTHAVGRLVTRLTSDVDAINEMFTGGILAIVDDFFTLTIMAICDAERSTGGWRCWRSACCR